MSLRRILGVLGRIVRVGGSYSGRAPSGGEVAPVALPHVNADMYGQAVEVDAAKDEREFSKWLEGSRRRRQR